MPTGYTYPIIEGEIDNFKDFAKLCMRAFGATIHMRDESMDTPYYPRTPSDYYTKQIETYKKNLEELDSKSDEELINDTINSLKEKKKKINENIKEIEQNVKRLKKILVDTYKWEPPTAEHSEAKSFMIQQLEDTIKHDGRTTYHLKELNEIDKQLSQPIDVKELKKTKREDLLKDIEYYEKNLKEEIDRCEKSNKWAEEFLNSL